MCSERLVSQGTCHTRSCWSIFAPTISIPFYVRIFVINTFSYVHKLVMPCLNCKHSSHSSKSTLQISEAASSKQHQISNNSKFKLCQICVCTTFITHIIIYHQFLSSLRQNLPLTIYMSCTFINHKQYFLLKNIQYTLLVWAHLSCLSTRKEEEWLAHWTLNSYIKVQTLQHLGMTDFPECREGRSDNA